jgi:hypothetical protein
MSWRQLAWYVGWAVVQMEATSPLSLPTQPLAATELGFPSVPEANLNSIYNRSLLTSCDDARSYRPRCHRNPSSFPPVNISCALRHKGST